MDIERFEDATFTELRSDLLDDRGGSRQRQFLNLLQDGKQFCRYLEKNVTIKSGKRLPLLRRELNEKRYRAMPVDIEREIFTQWQEIMPVDACTSSLWGLVTFRHIEAGIIEPHFLISRPENFLSSDKQAIHISENGTDKEVNTMVRTALRRFCSLKEEQGNRSIYSHCVFARAWWRVYLCNEVCEQTGADPDRVMEVFRKSPTYWGRLMQFTVSRNSILGDMRVRDALVWALSRRVREEERSHIFTPNALDKIGRLIGIRSAIQELGVFSMDELKEMMEKEFIAALR